MLHGFVLMTARPVTHTFEGFREELHGCLRQQQSPHHGDEQTCHVEHQQANTLHLLQSLLGGRVVGISSRHQDLPGIILDTVDLHGRQAVEDLISGDLACRLQVGRRVREALGQCVQQARQLSEADPAAHVGINLGFAQVRSQRVIQLRPGIETVQGALGSIGQIQQHTLDVLISVAMFKCQCPIHLAAQQFELQDPPTKTWSVRPRSISHHLT
ncbi:hypothetical protein D3C77_276700 [compost metagenome]